MKEKSLFVSAKAASFYKYGKRANYFSIALKLTKLLFVGFYVLHNLTLKDLEKSNL